MFQVLPPRPISEFDDKYQEISYLNRGKFSKVFLYQNYYTGEFISVKVVKLNKHFKVKNIENEIRLQNSIIHENIMNIQEVYRDKNKYYLVMEYSEIGDMIDIIGKNELNELDKCKLIYQLINAISLLHQYKITHCDIKPENCIIFKVGNEYKLKLIDFGYSSSSLIYSRKGTMIYSSPESFEPEPIINHLTDLWSLGVTIYCLETSRMAFYFMEETKYTKSKMIDNIKKSIYNKNYVKNKILLDLITKLLIVDKTKRIPAYEALKHTYFDVLKISERKKEIDKMCIL